MTRVGARSLIARLGEWSHSPRVSRFGPYWLLVGLAVAVVVGTVSRHTGVASVYDEVTYLDWILSLPDNAIAQTGEHYSFAARELFACQGVMYYGTVGPECGGDYSNPMMFPQEGKTTADAYTPLFFWPVWLVAKGVSLLGPDLVYGARIAMLIWLVPTVIAMLGLMRVVGVRDSVAVPLIAIFTVSPFSWWTYTYLSTDAGVPLIGALSLLVAVRFAQGRGALWWLVPIAAAGQALKVTTFLGPLLAGLVLAIAWAARLLELRAGTTFAPTGDERAYSAWRWLLPLVVSGAAIGAVQIGWMKVRELLALGEPPNQYLTLPRGETGEYVFQIGNFLHGTITARPMQGYDGATWNVPTILGLLLVFLLIAGVIGAVLRRPESRLEFGLALGTAIAAVGFGPLLFFLLDSMDMAFSMPARYGAALLPAFFLSLGLLVRWRGARWLIGAAAVSLVAYTLVRAPAYLW